MHMQGHFRAESFKGQVGRISYSDSKLHVLMLTKAVARRWTDVYSECGRPWMGAH